MIRYKTKTRPGLVAL